MPTIFINKKNSYIPQYNFEKIELHQNFKNIVKLLDYLLQKYPNKFYKYIPYTFYKINNITLFKWHWDYNSIIANPNNILISDNDTIENINYIYIHYHHSQHNDDFIIDKIFSKIGYTNKYFVDIGSKDGKYVSNVYSFIKQNWKGLLIDPIADENDSDDNITFKNMYITPDNFETTLIKYSIPFRFDFLNIDIDGNDIHIVKNLGTYIPRVICIEANARDNRFKKNIYYDYNINNSHDQQASILSLINILEKDYTLVYNNGGNCFFINNMEINKLKKFNNREIKEYIKHNIVIIEKEDLDNNTHYGDRNKMKQILENYLTNGFEEHYPYICRYEL
jgi:hypothetical protein